MPILYNTLQNRELFSFLDFYRGQLQKSSTRSKAYRLSKLTNIALTYELASQLCNLLITVNTINTGLVATNGGESIGGFAGKMKGVFDKIARLAS